MTKTAWLKYFGVGELNILVEHHMCPSFLFSLADWVTSTDDGESESSLVIADGNKLETFEDALWKQQNFHM